MILFLPSFGEPIWLDGTPSNLNNSIMQRTFSNGKESCVFTVASNNMHSPLICAIKKTIIYKYRAKRHLVQTTLFFLGCILQLILFHVMDLF